MAIFLFFKMATAAMLDFQKVRILGVVRVKTTKMRHRAKFRVERHTGLCHCAKFGWNRRSSFDNMHAFRLQQFGWKTPIHAPKIGVLGGFDPLNGGHISETPKGTSLEKTLYNA